MKIIPAIDIIDGKCVRLTQGDYRRRTEYDFDPVDMAMEMEDAGIKYLHVVDLDGARSQHIVNERALYRIVKATNLQVDFGGGIKTLDDLKKVFDSGAQKATIGSIAANDPERFLLWLGKFGHDRLILGADGRNRKIAINGWKEETTLDVIDFIKYYQHRGIREVICTDVSKDGMLEGPAMRLYEEVQEQCSVRLTASGGVSTVKDLVGLKEVGCSGAIVGKAIFEGRISLAEIGELC